MSYSYYHAHPRPFHAHWEGGEFDVAEDTPRVQENTHAKFHENRFSSVVVHRELTDTQTNRHTASFIYIDYLSRNFEPIPRAIQCDVRPSVRTSVRLSVCKLLPQFLPYEAQICMGDRCWPWEGLDLLSVEIGGEGVVGETNF